MGPAVEGIGLNVTAWSYCGNLAFALIADADAVADPHPITDTLGAALGDLKRGTLHC